jgi:integrase
MAGHADGPAASRPPGATWPPPGPTWWPGRPALRHLTLDDLDLANRRITIGGHTRPLDQLTHRLLLAWLAERHVRFPRTANRHLFVSKQTTHETGPVSDWWCYLRFRGLSVTLEQMRIDRQLDEALAGGGDPLHLAAVFGISELTAMHYAAAARALLAGNLEQQGQRADAPAFSRRNPGGVRGGGASWP